MKKKFRWITAMTLALALTLCACGPKKEQSTSVEDVEFPLEEPVTLTIWAKNNTSELKNYAEMGMYKEAMKRLGVKLEFTHPISSNVREQFNLMIASKEWPDILEEVNTFYEGGLNQAYHDEVIIDLTEYTDKYAPNLKALFDEYPQLSIESLNEDKHMLAMPMLRGGGVVRTYMGPIFRNDLLEKYGLDIPETVDDWYNVLTTFKKNGVQYPFTGTTLDSPVLTGAFDFVSGIYLDEGKVTYGYNTENYKDYILTMRKWYSEGLIDPELFTNDTKMVESKVINGKAGAYIASKSTINGYGTAAKKIDPSVDLRAVPYMAKDSNSVNYFIMRDPIYNISCGSSVTTASKNKEIAIKFLDYFYGKEGHMLANFGVEGESYTMVDGNPVYTEYVTNNPDGLTMSQAGSKFCRAFTMGAFVQDYKYGNQFYGLPRQQEASEIWTRDLDKYIEKNTVVKGALTPQENAEFTQLQAAINTYVSENTSKWIMGLQPVDNFDEYYDMLKKLGIDRVIEIKQNAHDRYISLYPEMELPYENEVADFFWK